MKIRHILTILFLLTGLFVKVFHTTAQENAINNLEFSLSFGNADIKCDRFSNSSNLDWMNYVGHPIYNRYELINWDIRFDILDHYKADISFIMENDFTPITFKTSFQYYINKWLGFHSGLRSYNTYIESASSYFTDIAPDYYYEFHFDGQRKVYNLSTYCGPAINIDNRWFKWSTTLNIGVSFQAGFKDYLYRKTPDKNEHYAYYYNVKPQNNFMYGYSSMLDINCFKIKNKQIGLLLKYEFQHIKKQTNYNLKTENWLGETTNKYIKAAKHDFKWAEWDAGFFIRF